MTWDGRMSYDDPDPDDPKTRYGDVGVVGAFLLVVAIEASVLLLWWAW